MSDYRKSRFTLARLMLGICLMNEKVHGLVHIV